jgi:hypothetical protein
MNFGSYTDSIKLQEKKIEALYTRRDGLKYWWNENEPLIVLGVMVAVTCLLWVAPLLGPILLTILTTACCVARTLEERGERLVIGNQIEKAERKLASLKDDRLEETLRKR